MNQMKEIKPIYEVRNVNNLKEMLDSSVELFGNNPAFKFKRKGEIISKTYIEFKNDVEALGTALIDLGLKNSHISVMGNNSYKWCTTYMAVVNGVGTIVPMDKAIPTIEIENILMQANPKAIICEEKYVETLKSLQEKYGIKYIISMDAENDKDDVLSFDKLIKKGNQLLKSGNTEFFDSSINNTEPRIILFTSGTTSNSKAVLLSHKNLCSNLMAVASVVKYKPEDTLLSVLPIHHTFECLVSFLLSLYSGSCTAFCEGLKHISDNLQEYNISVFATVPAILESIYSKLKKVKLAKGFEDFSFVKALYPNFRLAIVGAASIDKTTIVGFNEMGISCQQGYGLTETSPVLSVETDICKRPGSIGLPLPGVQIRIDNPNSEGIGEICAKGDNVMIGYYNNEEATNEVLQDGWFHTGDLGYLDDDCFLFICGRKKTVIVLDNGKNVFPEEVEVVLNLNDEILESFVYAEKKDSRLELHAEIVYDLEHIKEKYGDISEEEIYSIIDGVVHKTNKTLPLFKYIRKFTLSTEPILKTTTNKIKRYAELEKIKNK